MTQHFKSIGGDSLCLQHPAISFPILIIAFLSLTFWQKTCLEAAGDKLLRAEAGYHVLGNKHLADLLVLCFC